MKFQQMIFSTLLLSPLLSFANVVGVDAQNFNPTSNGLDFASQETGTVSNRPKLTVTYGTGSVAGEQVTFSVTGDYPYGRNQLEDLDRHIEKHNLYSPSDFFVHVGDIFGQSEGCRERYYVDVAERLKKTISLSRSKQRIALSSRSSRRSRSFVRMRTWLLMVLNASAST